MTDGRPRTQGVVAFRLLSAITQSRHMKGDTMGNKSKEIKNLQIAVQVLWGWLRDFDRTFDGDIAEYFTDEGDDVIAAARKAVTS